VLAGRADGSTEGTKPFEDAEERRGQRIKGISGINSNLSTFLKTKFGG
jgi:hypothetical protein